MTSLILCLFVNFVFSNTVFMHTHVGADGHPITHSHPYFPSAAHGHSALQFDQIAGFNACAAAMELTSVADLAAPTGPMTFIAPSPAGHTAVGISLSPGLRAPPAA